MEGENNYSFLEYRILEISRSFAIMDFFHIDSIIFCRWIHPSDINNGTNDG